MGAGTGIRLFQIHLFQWTGARTVWLEGFPFRYAARNGLKVHPATSGSRLCGLGPDPIYVRWYEEMLELTEPNGLFYAYADYSVPDDYLPTQMLQSAARIPLPPPGEVQEM